MMRHAMMIYVRGRWPGTTAAGAVDGAAVKITALEPKAMTKKELLARIEQLERRVRDLEARPPIVFAPPPVSAPGLGWPAPVVPFDPVNPYKITCTAQ